MTQFRKLIVSDDPLSTLHNCDGYYECPKTEDGRRLGPLVAYAGKYKNPSDEDKRWVGDVYYNFAKIEKYPPVLALFAKALSSLVPDDLNVDAVLGAPMGGLAFAQSLALHLDCEFAFAEKKVIGLEDSGREKSVLIMKRHDIMSGSKVLIVEDVCNNFSTTEQICELIRKNGAEPVGIACELNRSGQTEWQNLPVIALMDIPTVQFKQEDPEVAADIENSNVVWDAKKDWDILMKAMADVKA